MGIWMTWAQVKTLIRGPFIFYFIYLVVLMEEMQHQLIGNFSVYPIIYRLFLHPSLCKISSFFHQQYKYGTNCKLLVVS